MTRLLPEVKDKDDKTEEAQPGTGASFRFPCCSNRLGSLPILNMHCLSEVGFSFDPGKLVLAERDYSLLGNLGAEG